MTTAPLVLVKGAPELRKSLKRAGEDLSDLKDAHQAVGNLVANTASGIAPRQTGALAGSIRASRSHTYVIIRAGSAGIPYAGPIHWGWPARNIQADPFIMNAAQSAEPEWTALYEREMVQIIERIEGDK